MCGLHMSLSISKSTGTNMHIWTPLELPCGHSSAEDISNLDNKCPEFQGCCRNTEHFNVRPDIETFKVRLSSQRMRNMHAFLHMSNPP